MFAEFENKHGAALCIALDSYCTVVRAHDIAGYGKPKSSPCAMLFVTAPEPLEHLFTSPEMESLKARLKATWMAGDYGLIAKSIEPCAEEFVTRLALKSGIRLLDVACGNGNVAIPAARAKAAVTRVDIAVNLLEQARARAESEGLVIQFDNGDAELQQKIAALPPGKRYVALPREYKSIEQWQREFSEEAEKQRASEIDIEHPHLTLMRGNKNA